MARFVGAGLRFGRPHSRPSRRPGPRLTLEGRRHRREPGHDCRFTAGSACGSKGPRYFCWLVQNAHRLAAIGMSLRHSGHFFVVGSGGTSPRFIRAINALTGTTTKK